MANVSGTHVEHYHAQFDGGSIAWHISTIYEPHAQFGREYYDKQHRIYYLLTQHHAANTFSAVDFSVAHFSDTGYLAYRAQHFFG